MGGFSKIIINGYYRLKKHQKKLLLFMILISWFLGTWGYKNAYVIGLPEAAYRAATQFAMQTDMDILKQNMINISEEDKNTSKSDEKNGDIHPKVDTWIYCMILVSAIIAMASVLLGAVLLFMEDTLVALRTASIIKRQGYRLIIGLGKNSQHYLNNMRNSQESSFENTIIVDKNNNTILLQPYKEAGLGVMIDDASDVLLLQRLNIENVGEIFISAGSDEKNIEIVLEIIALINDDKDKSSSKKVKLIVGLSPQGKRHYYTNEGLLDVKNEKVDIQIFSYADEAARDLFENYDIDGDDSEIIDSHKSFAMMVIGSGELAAEVIYHGAMLSVLPNENRFTIYCVDDEAQNLKKRIEYLFGGIRNIEQIDIQYLSDYRVSSSQIDGRYFDRKIKNIIVCDDNQAKNIEIAADLVERVYRHQKASPKIIAAIYDMPKIADQIDNNSNLHKGVFAFAQSTVICSKKFVLSEERYKIAKVMHAWYTDIFDQNALIESDCIINKKWETSKISDKASNLAQAQHIKAKLKALGLKITESQTTDIEILLEDNRNVLDDALSKYNIKTDELFNEILAFTSGASKNLVDNYFPNSNNMESLFVRLINSEHERWNRFHYLNNWDYIDADKANKSLKLHNCLKPFSEFKDAQKETIHYDIYSIVYIANYCAQVGYKLEPIESIEIVSSVKAVADVYTIGVTGHRDIVENNVLVSAIDERLKSLKKDNRSFEILSPLADGADMLVAERAIKVLDAKLKVLFPFDPAVYQCGSKKYAYGGIEQKERFNRLLNKAIETKNIGWINSNPDDRNMREQFEKCGQSIVEQCDVLIALYDGKPSKGKGGTAEIVEYAKERGSQVFLIDVRRKGE